MATLSLTAPAESFAEYIASHTGLSLLVVRAWVSQESWYGQSPSGNFNYLNMRNPAGGWQTFSSWQTAAQAVIHQLQIAPAWYGSILKSAGKPDAQQVAAIANSPWDAGHYGGAGGVNLVNRYNTMFTNDIQPYTAGAVSPKGANVTASSSSSSATAPDAYNYGEFGAYLNVPELNPILTQAAREHWDSTKLQMAIFATNWWKQRTDAQHTWGLKSPAQQQADIARELTRLDQEFETNVWGTLVGHQAQLKQAAIDIASGKVDESIFLYQQTVKARGTAGTPAYRDWQDQQKRAGQAKADVEDLTGQLQDTWRQWMGNGAPMPNLGQWANNIYANKNSQADFLNFVKGQAKSLYPNMPDNVPFSTYVAPAKSLMQQTLELGNVKDDDPMLQSYVQGKIPSLADLKDRLMRDPRLADASWWKQQQQQTGFQLTKAMGLS